VLLLCYDCHLRRQLFKTMPFRVYQLEGNYQEGNFQELSVPGRGEDDEEIPTYQPGDHKAVQTSCMHK